MKIIPDTSMAMAWLVERLNRQEAELAQNALWAVRQDGGIVPGHWFAELTNTLLIAERKRVADSGRVTAFLQDLAMLPIEQDAMQPQSIQLSTLALSRLFILNGYHAACLELAMRTGHPLATFDRHLAEAVRKAGGNIFGDHG